MQREIYAHVGESAYDEMGNWENGRMRKTNRPQNVRSKRENLNIFRANKLPNPQTQRKANPRKLVEKNDKVESE